MMDAISRLVLRNLRSTRFNQILNRNIMTTSSRCAKAMEELETNPYFQKYSDKIAKLQKTSPEEFLNRIETQKQELEKQGKAKEAKERQIASLLQPKEKTDKPDSQAESMIEIESQKQDVGTQEKVKERQFTSLLQPKQKIDNISGPQNESLDKIMKIDLIKDKTTDEIKDIWGIYHIQKEVIAATIPSPEFDTIFEVSRTHPIFLFALPRSQGYEFFMSQFQGNSIHFTPLICYQVHKENAPECLTIKHYTEFKDDKGIVLMRGEFDKNVIDVKEAQCLANQLQLYYNKRDAEKSALLEKFTMCPHEFKHQDLIKQIENLSLG